MWGKIVSGFAGAFDFNTATLSGTVDIICVRQENGDIKSTPFHVRFGKAKLLRSREKLIFVTVNGVDTEVKMKLGAAGEAYFVDDDAEEAAVPSVMSSPARPGAVPDEDNIPQTAHDTASTASTAPPIEKRADIVKGSLPPEGSDVRVEERGSSESEIPQVAMSLCGHLLDGGISETEEDHQLFEKHRLTHEDFDFDPSLWFHPNLVVRLDGQPPYFPGKVALPVLTSLVAFDRAPSLDAVQQLMGMTVTTEFVRDRSLLSWVFGTPASQRERAGASTPGTAPGELLPLPPPQHEDELERRRQKNSLRPSSEQLEKMKLVDGPNTVIFSVTSALQGTKIVKGTIYLWPSNAKIVISDVDGTITKSDLIGQLAPIVGRDWTHAGVANLFDTCHKNGYQVVYLSARAIGQADATRDYLFGLTQDCLKLPDGPLILSPDRLFPSFRREVIDRKPYVFKIAALGDIRKLFPSHYNPFYAGFGNRDSDHRSYVHIGVPENRVFIIDPKGTIHHVNKNYAKTYDSMSEISELMFPPLAGFPRDSLVEDDQFNSFNYWSLTLHRTDTQKASEDLDCDGISDIRLSGGGIPLTIMRTNE